MERERDRGRKPRSQELPEERSSGAGENTKEHVIVAMTEQLRAG